jgi:flagellar hook-basal body protein
LFTGVTGLKAHQIRLDVVSNNIANVNTTGFKASRVRFDDVLSQTVEIATAPESGRGGQNPKQIGLGVLGTTISRDMSQGPIEITNKTTDLAIQGNGMFVLRDGEQIGEYYSRDGNFAIDSQGDLVLASNGFRVQGWNAFLDAQSREYVINSANPVEDIQINLTSQMAPIATSSVDMGGNLDSRMDTALDPLRVSWIKNGVEREVEMRFTHVHPTRDLYLWQVFDPTTIDPATGDFTQIATDTQGLEASGIIEVDEDGRVIANYLNTADDDAADPATNFLSATEVPNSGQLWALNNPTRTFNGYDFISLDTNGDGDSIQVEANSRATSVSSAAAAVAGDFDVTLRVPNAPLSSTANVGGDYPNGFTQDAVYQTGVGPAGNGVMPGEGLGVPVQYIDAISNEVVTKMDSTRSFLQLSRPLVIGTGRENPAQNGALSQASGTDTDSLRLFIDGREWTRVSNATVFTAGSTQYKLNEELGIIELGFPLPNGVNAVVSYSAEIRPTNTRTIPNGRTINAEFGAAPNVGTSSQDLSTFYAPGSATLILTDVSAGVAETFTEIPFGQAPAANQFVIDPSTGNVTFGTFASTAAVDTGVAGDTVAGSYQTYRAWAGEQTVSVAVGTTVDAAEAAFLALADSGGQNPPYVPGSIGTITVTDGVRTETFTEVTFGQALGVRQFSVNPASGDLTFGTYFDGSVVTEATNTFATLQHDFDFYNKRIGVTDGAGTNHGQFAATTNVMGWNDLWRVNNIAAGGSETGDVRLWLQGDGFDGLGAPNQPTATSLTYLPTIGSTQPNRRAEINYESDDRVNIIIPNGLTKTPNVNPLTDLTAEAFSFTPNTSQITGNSGNNNQADSGDSQTIDFKNPEEYQFTTAVQVYDSLGTPHNVPLRFEHIATNQWLMYAIDPTDPDGERIAFTRLLAFRADGTFDSSSTIPYESPTADTTTNDGFMGIYFDPPRAGGAAPPNEGADPVLITPDFSNLVQTARGSDAVVTEQNGFPPGKLETFSFNDQGFLVGLFDNGRSRNLARIALQGFVNPAGLVAVGGNMFKDTVNAGRFGSPQRPGFDGVGTIVPGALESSNVDLSVEFVDLIITQRGFQAQSRTITTADQVLQEVLSLKR